MPLSREDAFLKAFDEYGDMLSRHASFRVRNRDRAADLTQETFLKAWDYLRSGKEIQEWKAFLFRVLNNLIIDEYRRKKEQSLDALLEEGTGEIGARLAVDSRSEKEERLDDAMLIEKIRALIPQLPEQQQQVLTLRYVDGLSPGEIAKQLGTTENTASVRIHRAVQQLKALCGPLSNL